MASGGIGGLWAVELPFRGVEWVNVRWVGEVLPWGELGFNGNDPRRRLMQKQDDGLWGFFSPIVFMGLFIAAVFLVMPWLTKFYIHYLDWVK